MMVLYLLLILLGGVLILLATPIGVRYEKRPDGRKHNWALLLLNGLIVIPLNGASGEAKRQRPKQQPARPKQRTKKSLRSAGRFAGDPALWSGFIQTAIKILRAVQWRERSVSVRFGLDDPADTGLIYGFLTPLLSVPGIGRHFKLEPVFDDTAFEISAKLDIRIIPITIIWIVLRFVLSRPVRQIMFRGKSSS